MNYRTAWIGQGDRETVKRKLVNAYKRAFDINPDGASLFAREVGDFLKRTQKRTEPLERRVLHLVSLIVIFIGIAFLSYNTGFTVIDLGAGPYSWVGLLVSAVIIIGLIFNSRRMIE